MKEMLGTAVLNCWWNEVVKEKEERKTKGNKKNRKALIRSFL